MYKITIERTEIVRQVVDGDWVILEEKGDEKTRGYAPARERDVSITKEIYMQQVDDLDLVRVISAINGVEKPAVIVNDHRKVGEQKSG